MQNCESSSCTPGAALSWRNQRRGSYVGGWGLHYCATTAQLNQDHPDQWSPWCVPRKWGRGELFLDEGNPYTRPRLIDVENFPYRTMLLSIAIRYGFLTKEMYSFKHRKFLPNYICIPCKNHENLWSAFFELHSNWSQYFEKKLGQAEWG